MARARSVLAAIAVAAAVARAGAQPAGSTRLAILNAEDRRAPTAHDVAVIRGGLRSRDAETARIAVRALGRLERPELIPEIVPLLKSPLPELRAEAANAIGQAAQGWKASAPPKSAAVQRTGRARPAGGGVTVDAAAAALIARLPVEDEPSVRGAVCQAIGRLPYASAEQVERAEAALTESLGHEDSTDGRLGVAQGLEALIRLQRQVSPPSRDTIVRLVDLASGSGINGAARVRRLALEALVEAGAVTDQAVLRAAADADPQVRRLAMRAVSANAGAPGLSGVADVLKKALADPSPMVRLEALRAEGIRGKGTEASCAVATAAVSDRDSHVALTALDQLAACSASADAVAALERAVNDLPQAGAARGWHRAAHAIVALAAANGERAKTALPQLTGSSVWQLRMYAARAAAALGDRAPLEKLAADADDNVVEAAITGLSKVAEHGGDALYVAALSRRGYQAIRAAARALAHGREPADDSSGRDSAVAGLKTALQRLNAEDHDNSRDARAAIADALETFGVHVDRPKPVRDLPVATELTADNLRRLASARARFTIRGVGVFELALFTSQAPATAIRFAHLAQAGYYDGLTFHRVVPNFVVQGGSPGANEYIGDAAYMRDEVGRWPHVRGAVGISTRGRDTGDAQIFIDLVDNPRLDHEYTVFAQVLSGMDVVDQILEGDVIEKVEILTG